MDLADLEKTNVVTTVAGVGVVGGFLIDDASAASLVPVVLSAEAVNINGVSESGEAEEDKEDSQESHNWKVAN